jgi:hypothetical protein
MRAIALLSVERDNEIAGQYLGYPFMPGLEGAFRSWLPE